MRKIGEKEFDDNVEPAAAVVDNSEQSDDEDDEKCSVLQCDVRLLTMMSTGLMSNLVGEVIEDLFDDAGEAALSHAVEKFPELEIKDEEVDLDETNALKPDPHVDSSSNESLFDDDLDGSQENELESYGKAKKDDNDTRVTDVKNAINVVVKKPVSDGTVPQEPEPSAAIARNIPTESEEYMNPDNTKLKTLKLKIIAKLEKLIYSRKVATIPVNAITMDKYWFDKEHNCVLAKVFVIVIATKPTGTLVNYSQMMNDMIGLDNLKKPVSFPWRPEDMLCWVCCHALMCVLVLQLLLVFKDYNIVTTVTYNKFSLESEDGELELLCPKLSLFVFLLDVANTDLDQEENVQEDVLLNEIASADTFMVLLTLLSQA